MTNELQKAHARDEHAAAIARVLGHVARALGELEAAVIITEIHELGAAELLASVRRALEESRARAADCIPRGVQRQRVCVHPPGCTSCGWCGFKADHEDEGQG